MIEARVDQLEDYLDYRYPYACLDFLRDIVLEATAVLDQDFYPQEHFVFIRLPIVGEYES